MKQTQQLTWLNKAFKVQNKGYTSGSTTSYTRAQYHTSGNGVKCCSTADRLQFWRASDLALLLPSLPSRFLTLLLLLTVNGTEAVAVATRPPETSTVTGLLVMAGIGLFCWALSGPVKSYWNTFTKSHGPHPKASGGASGGGAPGKPGTGDGASAPGKPSAGTTAGKPSADTATSSSGTTAGKPSAGCSDTATSSTSATPGKLGPGGHEFADAPNPQELARSISDSFGIGQPRPPAPPGPFVDPRCVWSPQKPPGAGSAKLEWLAKLPRKPSFPDGTYTLQAGDVDPLIIRQIMRILNDGLSSTGLSQLKLEGIYKLYYIGSGVAVELHHPETGLYEQTIIPRELIAGWDQRHVLNGVNWYHYPQEILPVHPPVLSSLTTGEMVGVGLAAILIPGAAALLYRNWGYISTRFRLQIRSRHREKLGKFAVSHDYLPVTDYDL